MSRWIVLEPPAAGGARPEAPSEHARLVRDRFAGWAVLFPFLWLFRHGLVVSGLVATVLWFGFGLLAEMPGFGFAAALLPLLLGCLVALEGPSLRAARLRRKGFRDVAVVEADNEAEAAILYYAAGATEAAEPAVPPPEAPPSRPTPAPRAPSLLDPPRKPA